MSLKNQNRRLLFAHLRAALAQLAKSQKHFNTQRIEIKILQATRTARWKCQNRCISANATTCRGRGKSSCQVDASSSVPQSKGNMIVLKNEHCNKSRNTRLCNWVILRTSDLSGKCSQGFSGMLR